MRLKALATQYCPSFLRPALERIDNSPLGSRLATGVFWTVAGTAISQGLMLCASILVARMLGKTGFGELGMIRQTVGMFGVFAGFGLGLTATKHVAEFRNTDPERAGRIIGLSGLFAFATGGIIALGLLIFAPLLAERSINAPHLAGVLRIGTLILFVSTLNGAQTGALSGFEAFKTIARVNLIGGLASFPLLLGGTWLGIQSGLGGLAGAVWALGINQCILWLLNHLALRQEARRYGVPFTLKKCTREWSILWKFSLPAVLAGCMGGPVNWLCAAMLANQPGGYGKLGIFTATYQWYWVLKFVPASLGQVLLPILATQLNQNHQVQSMLLGIKANAVIVFPFVVLASIASPVIMGLYGDGFQGEWPTLICVLITAAILAVEYPMIQIMYALGAMWSRIAVEAGWALTLIISTYLLLSWGVFGFAMAGLIARVVHLAWTLCFAFWYIYRKGENNSAHNQTG